MSKGNQPEHVMEALLALLAERPELRVGQAIAIATHQRTGRFDPFSVEDADLARAIEQLRTEARRDDVARSVLGRLGAQERNELDRYLADEGTGALSDWVWGLSRWGKPVLVLAALGVAEPCLGTWEQGVPDDAQWQHHFAHSPEPAQALAALRAWLREPSAEAEAQLHSRLTALRKRVSAAESYAEESSGSGERVRRQRQCAAAGGAVQLALEAATWTAEQATAGTVDDGERQAMMAAGPARETWGAVRAFLVAHPEASERVARDHIRRVLMAPR